METKNISIIEKAKIVHEIMQAGSADVYAKSKNNACKLSIDRDFDSNYQKYKVSGEFGNSVFGSNLLSYRLWIMLDSEIYTEFYYSAI